MAFIVFELLVTVAVFITFFVISFIGCYFRYPNKKNGKRLLLPSRKAVKRASGTGFWATVLYLVYQFVLKPILLTQK